MVIQSVELEIVCGVTSKIPHTGQCEIAFAGKSNVGKSSLINALMQRKALARTSSSPGKTQTINFYHINESLYFVDLPGYGYAKVSRTESQKWGRMIEGYLTGSQDLKVIFILVDIRHAPNANDKQMMEWIRFHGFQPVIIATKLDKIKRSALQKQLKLIRETLQVGQEVEIIPFSSQTKQGREQIWEYIDNMMEAGSEQNEDNE